MGVWPEISTAKTENRHEVKLAGASISKRIAEDGLDHTLFQLTNLNMLNISDTCLSAIPDDIKNLVNLQTLLLYGNKLQVFNENITSLRKLKVLDLSRNQLTTIPDTINNMKELTSINFSSNQIEIMPILIEFPNLITIDLSNNKLTSFLEVENSNMPHLTDLKLRGNAIQSIPSHLPLSLPSLKNLDVSDNQLSTVPGELASMAKLKELNIKGNKLADKRLMKLIDQCRMKQIMDYIRDHCPKSNQAQLPTPTKGRSRKSSKKVEEPQPESSGNKQCHSMNILHVEDNIPKVIIVESEVKNVRPHILCCIVNDLKFNEAVFKKFIQMQTKLHDTVCDKRNVATIATHDLKKIAPGDLKYTAKAPAELSLVPLSRLQSYTGEQLYRQLSAEAEALRKEKKRSMYSGIHKYLYMLEGKSKYSYLEDASGNVISLPPITNSETTKMSHKSKSMFIEVTSHLSLGSCKMVMDKMLQECLELGIGNDPEVQSEFHTLTVQQVKIVDSEGNLKSVYPSRADLVFDDNSNIRVFRLSKK